MKIKTYVELQVEVDVDYTPERPAPACQDHDSPRFCDSGDDEFIEITDVKFVIGAQGRTDSLVPVPNALMTYICDTIIDDVADQCRDGRHGGVDHLDVIKDTIRAMRDIPTLAGYRK
jgi:hypothetical protein